MTHWCFCDFREMASKVLGGDLAKRLHGVGVIWPKDSLVPGLSQHQGVFWPDHPNTKESFGQITPQNFKGHLPKIKKHQGVICPNHWRVIDCYLFQPEEARFLAACFRMFNAQATDHSFFTPLGLQQTTAQTDEWQVTYCHYNLSTSS